MEHEGVAHGPQGPTQYDFVSWKPELFYPIQYYANGKKKPAPGPKAKSLRMCVSRTCAGRDNLITLGDAGRLVGEAYREYREQVQDGTGEGSTGGDGEGTAASV